MHEKTNAYLDNKVIADVFARQVEKQPNQYALIDQAGALTYAALDAFAHRLASQFPHPAKRVGVIMDHGRAQIASILAILQEGGCYVPAEPDFPLERIAYMMQEAAVDFVITNTAYQANLSSVLAGIPVVTIEEMTSALLTSDGAGAVPEKPIAIQPTDPAYILYTSGSTGRPKGVEVLNTNVCNYARAFEHEFHVHPGDRMLQYSVCSFDIFVEEVFTTLLNGATLVIPPKEVRNNLDALMPFADKLKVTIMSGFPYLLQACNERDDVPASLRLFISGGDVLRANYVTNLIKTIQIYNTYGPSETCVCATYCNCLETPAQPDGTYPVGRPVQGVSVVLCDETLNPVPKGEVGEIIILGEGVSAGYIGDRVQENKAFLTLGGKRAYRSGDLGVELDDGQIHFLRRKDDQVMILGKRVEPGEVANVINLTQHVKQTFVDPETDAQGLTHLTAYVVPGDETFTLTDLKHMMAAYLPSYMIPEDFVVMQSLPLTPNGKVDKTALMAYKASA